LNQSTSPALRSAPRSAPEIPASIERPRVLVVGCGGIGGVVTAHLARARMDQLGALVALSTNEEIAREIHHRGMRVRGSVDAHFDVRATVVTELSRQDAPFDLILLATQPPQVEDAARRALPFLSEAGAMVCLQNGLCEQRVARIAGEHRVLGAVVAWGASMPEPGVYERTSRGGFTLGRADGRTDDGRLRALASALDAIGPVKITDNLSGVRWSKLAINSAISTLGTLGGDRLGVLLRRTVVRRLALEIMSEAVEVARAEQVRLEKVAGTLDLDWLALSPSERRGSATVALKHAVLLAVGLKYRRMRSSMLSAIERGRPPSVDFLNGELVSRGAQRAVKTPVNAEATQRVHALARGEAKPGPEQIDALARAVGVKL
jgi:2-dehydropantoate 2-reductase